jgi:hypothetical protein
VSQIAQTHLDREDCAEQWTEELALLYRAALSQEIIRQYAGPAAQQMLKAKGKEKLLSANWSGSKPFLLL